VITERVKGVTGVTGLKLCVYTRARENRIGLAAEGDG